MKYKKGQRVYFMDNNEIGSGRIEYIFGDIETYFRYSIKLDYVSNIDNKTKKQEDIFPSVEHVLDHLRMNVKK